MSWQRHATEILLMASMGLLISWDLYAAFTPNATISEIFLNLAYRHPAVPFVLGCICGHLTWPVETTRPGVQTMVIVVGTIVMAMVVDRFAKMPAILPVLPLVVGIVCGHSLWPQRVATEVGETLLSPTSIKSDHFESDVGKAR